MERENKDLVYKNKDPVMAGVFIWDGMSRLINQYNNTQQHRWLNCIFGTDLQMHVGMCK